MYVLYYLFLYYLFQPFFADFIFQCYDDKEFISHYRFHQKKTNTDGASN